MNLKSPSDLGALKGVRKWEARGNEGNEGSESVSAELGRFRGISTRLSIAVCGINSTTGIRGR